MISLNQTFAPVQRVLLIDHDRRFGEDARLLVNMQPNMELIAWLPDCQSAVRYAEDLRPDVVVFGWSWGAAQSVRELRRLRTSEYSPAIVVFADDGDLGAFVAAKRCGAHSVHYRCNMGRALKSALRRLCDTTPAAHSSAGMSFPPRNALP